MRHDVVVVGSGVAGMTAALVAASTPGPARPRVALVTGGRLVSGSTRWAQGGLAASIGADDSPALHAADTVAAGRGLCDPDAVAVLTGEAAARVRDLVAWGVGFDRTADGDLALGREAAHSRHRILHGGGDATGQAISEALAARLGEAGVDLLEGWTVTRLLRDGGGACAGVEAVDGAGDSLRLAAPATVLATGGAGRLWARTTNPEGADGAALALAFDAGAELASMEFTQFHPTALALAGAPAFLLSEAMRGEGATVVDRAGRRFLFDADPRGELAPRDVVASAIWRQLVDSGEACVWLDATAVRGAESRFPTIARTLRERGIEVTVQPIPIAPAAHYSIGGVRTSLEGATAVPGLFACGEVASTGVHGANRLASNSLLEGVVFGHRAGRAALAFAAEAPAPRPLDDPPAAAPPATAAPDPATLRRRLQEAMDRGAGLVRDRASLEAAAGVAAEVADAATALPFPLSTTLRASARTASLVCRAALLREESRGSHQRSDRPAADETQAGVWVLHLDRGHHLDRNPRSTH